MIVSFETSAFLPPLTGGQTYYPAWERYRLEVADEEWNRIISKREELAECVSRGEISNARLRQFDRRVIKRYSI